MIPGPNGRGPRRIASCAMPGLPPGGAAPTAQSPRVQPSRCSCHSCSHGVRLCFSRKVSTMALSRASTAPTPNTPRSIAAYSSLLLRASMRWNLVFARNNSKTFLSSGWARRSFRKSASTQTSRRHRVWVASSAMLLEDGGSQSSREKRSRKLISPSQPPAWPPSSTRLTGRPSPQRTSTSPCRSSMRSERLPPASLRRELDGGT
mmetsp:Transcript_88431/g.250647  ORF Transcript_88431/g.250647 Transcript_88431/m.250647 type:complete len:205 (-) Transcript_88431:409-1023(-)